LGNGVGWLRALRDPMRARIEEALIEMDSYARSAIPRADEFALNALERALLRLDAATPRPAKLSEPVQEAVLFFARHLDQHLTVEDIARAVSLSPSRLAHLFKQQVGTSPARFVEQRRMERAQVLLSSSALTIAAVSDAADFSSQFYFAARFKVHTGISPSQWRHRHAADQHAP
jgi:AraC family transcriptional regulator, arabinose operon regulatory protein